MRRKLLILMLPLLVLVGITLVLEAAFGARSWIEQARVSARPTAGKKRVLFIGDSILGFLESKGSIAGNLPGKLNFKDPNRFEFSEVSGPALRSWEIQRRLAPVLKKNSPDIVVMMVGKSDFSRGEFSLRALGPLSRLRIARLFEAAYWDLRNQWLRFRESPPTPAELVLNEAQAAFRRVDCPVAIPLFEKALRLGITGERTVRSLHYCYASTGEATRGLTFYDELTNQNRFTDLLLNLRPALTQLNQPDLSALKSPIERPNRDLQRTRLWSLLLANQPEAFYKDFIAMPAEASDHLLPETVGILRQILDDLSNTGAKVYVLQYPLDYLSALEQDLGDLPKNVTLLDLRAWMTKAPEASVMAMFYPDIEHLSPVGSEYLAEQLAREILKNEP